MKEMIFKNQMKLGLGRVFIFFMFLTLMISFNLFSYAYAGKKSAKGFSKKIGVKQREKIYLNKKKHALPQMKASKELTPPRNLGLHSKRGYKAQLEILINKSIKQLYKLSIKLKNNPGRGEIWLRLAKAYFEKAKIIEPRIHEAYEKRMDDYLNKKSFIKPKLNLTEVREYNKKAIKLYHLYLRDFPKSKKLSQVLFFLGYGYFQINEKKVGEKYFLRLIKKFPTKAVTREAYFKLGEYYFNTYKWKDASVMYARSIQRKKSKLHFLSIYKLAWCHYKLGNYKIAFDYLRKIILVDKSRLNPKVRAYQAHLATEALNNTVVFYEGGLDHREARIIFKTFLSGEKLEKQIENLAYAYKNSNKFIEARYTFKDLIKSNPLSPKAFHYQLQILKLYLKSGNLRKIEKQFLTLIKKFGLKSVWYEVHEENKNLIKKSFLSMEEEYRFFILENHKTIQTTKNYQKAPFIMRQYKNYLSHFKNSSKIDEMYFFYAELLFESKKYEKSANHYRWITSNRKNSKYYKQAYSNLILSLENTLPSQKELIEMSQGKSKKEAIFNQKIEIFYKDVKRFLNAFPKNENKLKIKYKLAILKYYQKDFLHSQNELKSIIEENPRSKQAELSAQLMIDIHQIKKNDKDFNQSLSFLSNKMPNLPIELRKQIQNFQITKVFKSIENLEKEGKDSLYIANQYKALAEKKSEKKHLLIAFFNAALHFEKAGHYLDSIQYYTKFIKQEKKKPIQGISDLLKKAIKSRALLYEKVGLYKKAADEFTSFSKRYKKDQSSMELLLRAAMIYDGLRLYNKAFENYEIHYKQSPKNKKPEALYLMGDMLRRSLNFNKALIYFDRFMKNRFSERKKRVKVAFFLSEISDKIKRENRSVFWAKKTISIYSSLNSEDRRQILNFASQAEFKLAYLDYLKFKRIKMSGSVAQQSLALQKKLNLLETLKESLKRVISYGDGYQIVAALTVQGHAFKHITKVILDSPIPDGLKEKDIEIYEKEIEKTAQPFKKLYEDAYALAFEKVKEFKVFGKWVEELFLENQQRLPSSKMQDLSHFFENPMEYINELKGYRLSKIISRKESDILIEKVREDHNEDTLKLISKLISRIPNGFSLNLLGIYHTLRNEDGLAKIIFERALIQSKKKKHRSAIYNNLSILYVKEKDFRTAIAIKELE